MNCHMIMSSVTIKNCQLDLADSRMDVLSERLDLLQQGWVPDLPAAYPGHFCPHDAHHHLHRRREDNFPERVSGSGCADEEFWWVQYLHPPPQEIPALVTEYGLDRCSVGVTASVVV